MQKQMLKMIKLIATFLVAFNVVGCGSIPLPKGKTCVSHVSQNAASYNDCYDMEKDFDENGNILPTANGQHVPLEFDKRVNFDVDSFASLKAYLLKLKKVYQDQQSSCAFGGN